MSGPVRQRPLVLGALRAFEAVARHLNFRAAGEELHLTQSAVSRQIQGLEDEVGAPLFQRDTRQVSLTAQGAVLLRAVMPSLERIDAAVRQIRTTQARPRVSIETFASFATLWLIPRLEAFQRTHPGLDIRVGATDALVELDDPEIDLVLRFCGRERLPPGAIADPLFSEVLTPVASRWLMDRVARGEAPPLAQPADLARHTLLEEDTAFDPLGQKGWALSWRHWLSRRGLGALEPARWITFNYTHQQVQTAQAGQGVALGRLPLIANLWAAGDLVEPFGATAREPSDSGYWLLTAPASAHRPEVAALRQWILAQAAEVRALLGEHADAETLAGPTESD
jgi:LysR family transcriptional regulator, glycine cleavage system transcriptional activator